MYTVYVAVNMKSGKAYVGCTSKTMEQRRYRHEWLASKAPSTKCRPIHKAIRRNGKENFQWLIIGFYDTKEEASNKESFFIDLMNTRHPNGYNYTLGAGKKR